MLQYVTYLLAGFMEAYVNLLLWGVTAGPATSAPYFVVLSALLLGILITPVCVYLPKLSAIVALPLVTGVLIVEALLDSWRSLLSPFALPVVAVSIWTLVHQRNTPLMLVQRRWSWPRSAVMLLVPLILGAIFLNRAVLELLLSGPPF